MGFLDNLFKKKIKQKKPTQKKTKDKKISNKKKRVEKKFTNLSKIMKKEKELNKKFQMQNQIMKSIKLKKIKPKTHYKKEGDNKLNINIKKISKGIKKDLIKRKKRDKKEIKQIPKKTNKQKDISKRNKFDVAAIAKEIKGEIKKQRAPLEKTFKNKKFLEKKEGKPQKNKKYILTEIPGFDELLEQGIPQRSSILISGGAGSGKTIFCMQTLINKALEGKKCLMMSLEEKEEKLIKHMEDFGWPAKKLIKKGKLKIIRINPFDITRNVDALLAKQKGDLLIDLDPVILPKDFSNPDFIVIDSLTAIASAFTGKEESYRIYIEQLFRFLEKTQSISFLVTETEEIPKIFSPTGVEEFLADGVIVLYNLKHGNMRESAIEVLKLRGAAHKKKIVAMQITGKGIIVYPEQEVFSEI